MSSQFNLDLFFNASNFQIWFGFSSREMLGGSGRPSRSPSPDRKKLRWSDHDEVNFLDGAEVNFLSREPSSFIAMVDEPEDSEEDVPPPSPPPQVYDACDSDSDMEEDSISSSESDMPDLLTESDSEDEEEILSRPARTRGPPRNRPTIMAARPRLVVNGTSTVP
jgi:hypothetical protein